LNDPRRKHGHSKFDKSRVQLVPHFGGRGGRRGSSMVPFETATTNFCRLSILSTIGEITCQRCRLVIMMIIILIFSLNADILSGSTCSDNEYLQYDFTAWSKPFGAVPETLPYCHPNSPSGTYTLYRPGDVHSLTDHYFHFISFICRQHSNIYI